jgi:trigger factor
MESVVEDISATKKRITIKAAADEVEGRIRGALDGARAKSRIPGFRTGKAPMSLIERKYGKEIESEVLERLVGEYYADALERAGIKPITPPVLEEHDYKRKSDLRVVCSFEVRPVIENLNYDGVTIKEVKVDVTDEDIETAMMRIRINAASYAPVERPVQNDDLLIADIENADDGASRPDQYIKVGGEEFPREFYDAVTGKNKGEKVSVKVEFPKDNPNGEFFGGKALNVLIKEIKELKLPDIDDEFAKDAGFDGIEDMRKTMSGGILESKKRYAQQAQSGAAVKTLLERYEFELPDSFLNGELDFLVSQAAKMPANKDLTPEQLRDKYRGEAARSVKTMIILDAIGEKENVTVTEADMKEKLVGMSGSLSMSPEALAQYYTSQYGSLDGLRYTIFREKVADLILSRANVEKGE